MPEPAKANFVGARLYAWARAYDRKKSIAERLARDLSRGACMRLRLCRRFQLWQSRANAWQEDLGDGDVNYGEIAAFENESGFRGPPMGELAFDVEQVKRKRMKRKRT
jgi:hypothetical protein